MRDALFLFFTVDLNNTGGFQGMLKAQLVGFNSYFLHTR